MSAASPQQIKDLFDLAFDQPPEEQERFLAAACAGDDRLFAEVQRLLLLHARSAHFLEAPPLIQDSSISSPAMHSDAALGRRIGAYQVIRELGRGGMGAVFLASRADQSFEKQVAIKLVSAGLQNNALMRRFRREQDLLHHGHVVPGVTEDQASLPPGHQR